MNEHNISNLTAFSTSGGCGCKLDPDYLKKIIGESINSKLNKISKYLKKNKSDYLFISAPENVAWTLNIRGKDGPNTPMPNSRLIVSKTKKIYLIANKMKCKKIINQKIINSNQIIDLSEILKLKGDSFIIDENTCSIYFENLIKSKFKIKKKTRSNLSF